MENRLIELVTDWIYLMQNSQNRSQTFSNLIQEVSCLPYRHFQLAVVARSLAQPLPHIKPKIPLKICLFEEAHLDAVRQINRPSEAYLCARRLAAGHKGLSAFHEGQLAGYAWGCSQIDMTLERIYIELEPGDCFAVDSYTNPVFRNKGIQTALTLARFHLYRSLGYSRAVAYIVTDNYPSLAVWRKLGGEIINQIDFVRVGPWRRAHYQPAPALNGDAD